MQMTEESLFCFYFQAQITLKVISGLYQGVTTVELDNLAAETAATMTTKHPHYAHLAARIAVSNLHKETKKVFSGKTFKLCGLFHAKMCLWTYADSEGPDQPAHLRSLIRTFASTNRSIGVYQWRVTAQMRLRMHGPGMDLNLHI